MKTILFFNSLLVLVFCQSEGNDDHKHLHNVATNIMQNLQKEYIPSEGSNSGAANAPINHFHASELITKTDKLKITVGVKGTHFVSVESNGTVVNITTKFGVGAVASYSVAKEEIEEEVEENQILGTDQTEKGIDETLESMEEEYLGDNLYASPNEIKVLIGARANYNMKIKPKRKNEIEVTVNQGYVVASKTNITKGYTDS